MSRLSRSGSTTASPADGANPREVQMHKLAGRIGFGIVMMAVVLSMTESSRGAMKDGAWELGGFVPWVSYGELSESGLTPDAELGWGARIGYVFRASHEVELTYQEVSTSIFFPGLSGSGLDTSSVTIGYLHTFRAAKPLSFFLRGGVGSFSADILRVDMTDNGPAAYLGVGIRWFATERFHIRIGASVMQIYGSEDDETNGIVDAGVGFLLGGK